ncbi:MAG: xylulokinase [Christensenellales bacterium]|jgi:xylulokinase|nr:xylulokinase [Christensenellaceae bacterium]
MKYLLGVDFGGSSSKATLLGEDGCVYATSTQEYPTYYPHSGWAEQNPEDSWIAFVKNIRCLLVESGVKAEEIMAISLDAATHTAVLLDKNDRPVRNAIYWTDTRASSEAAELQKKYGEEIVNLSYNTVSSLWTLPQLMWLSRNEPEAIARTHKVLAMKDYIRYRLTGDFVTDDIEAMGFMLLDANKNKWSERLCEMVGLKTENMPIIVRPDQRLSPICKEALEETGLCADTIVIAGTTDTAMEVYAAGANSLGQATVKLATAGRICSITDHAVVDPCLVTYRHVIDGLWYPGTATKSCAASNRWYRDTFGGDYDELSEAAAQIERGSNGLFFHPYLQGEITPYLNDKLRASFVGATSHHTKAHFNRAVLEGIAFSMKDCYHTLECLDIAPKEAVLIGGGAKAPLWRQIMADMLNIPLRTVEDVDSSLGSAMLAGVACGVFTSHQEAAEKCIRLKDEIHPSSEGVAFYMEQFAVYKEIQAVLAPIYQKL